jgi:hypothetical protein
MEFTIRIQKVLAYIEKILKNYIWQVNIFLF